MKVRNTITICLVVLIAICSAGITVVAAPDTNSWEDGVVAVFIDGGEESNSNVRSAVLKIRSDPQSNRLEMMFMLAIDNYQGAERTGVTFNLNSLGTVVMKGNGTLSYHPETYFLHMEVFADRTGSVNYYAVLGVKDGYGEVLDMQAAFYDSQGIRSNTCYAQIRLSGDDEETTSQKSATGTKSTVSEAKTKHSETQTSNISPTKGNTLTKTTKNNSYSQVNIADADGETKRQTTEYDETEEKRGIQQESQTVIPNGKRKLVWIVLVSTAVGCGTAAPFLIRYIRRKKY